MRNFVAVSWREQVTLDHMMMMCALYYTNTLIWIVEEINHGSQNVF